MDQKSYRLLNILLAGITGALFLYAGFFYDGSGSVQCVVKKITSHKCATCGLTRSFHAILSAHWSEGLAFNRFGLPLFLFFAVQFLLRLSLAVAGFQRRYPQHLPTWDAGFALLTFLLAFGPLIVAQI